MYAGNPSLYGYGSETFLQNVRPEQGEMGERTNDTGSLGLLTFLASRSFIPLGVTSSSCQKQMIVGH